jgi:hypothetical protein
LSHSVARTVAVANLLVAMMVGESGLSRGALDYLRIPLD